MSDSVTVNVEQGALRGTTAATVHGGKYCSFKGIPYAKPPIGPLRFKSPEPPLPWLGVRDALEEGSPCIGYDIFTMSKLVGQEDCLYLNVYTPEVPTDGRSLNFPVMVFIHGGGFNLGDGGTELYGPDFLVDAGVILVTFNYRLGALGFLSTQDEVVAGNMGLKDQVLALHWVKDNINKFGGDPGNVTIFGESAGAMSVHFHMISPVSKGLFHRAIAHSGTVLTSAGFTSKMRERSFNLGKLLGLETNDSQELLNFLMDIPAEKLVQNAPQALTEEDKKRFFAFAFVPTIEANIEGAFLSEDPVKMMTDGRTHDVPFIIGLTSAECLGAIKFCGLLGNEEKMENFNANFHKIIAPDLLRLEKNEDREALALEIKKFYFGDSKITSENLERVVDLLSDLYVAEGTDAVVRITASAPSRSSPLYYYCFTSEAMPEFIQGHRTECLKGANHGEDLSALFKTEMKTQNMEKDCQEGMVRQLMVKMWTNFASVGDPTPTDDNFLTEKWEPYTANKHAYMDIDWPPKLKEDLFKERMEFWYSRLPPGSERN